MLRRLPLLAALAAAGAWTSPARAEEPAPAAAPAPTPAVPRASDEDAATAVAKFREDWKATGLKGDDKLMQRDFALTQLARVPHPLVVAELGDVARTGDEDLRPIAVAYLGLQKGTPALAGEQVLAAMKKHAKDDVLVLSGVQALGQLRYLGADDTLKALIKTEDYALKKAVIVAVGQVGDMRLMDELLKLLGVDPNEKAPDPGSKDEKKSGGKEVVQEGYSWEGAEAAVDTGTAGDGDQKAAEAKVKDQLAKNKAGAGKGGGGGGGVGGGGDGGGAGGRGGAARSKEELKPYILRSLKALTGETFMNSKELRLWLGKSTALISDKKKAAADLETQQREALKR